MLHSSCCRRDFNNQTYRQCNHTMNHNDCEWCTHNKYGKVNRRSRVQRPMKIMIFRESRNKKKHYLSSLNQLSLSLPPNTERRENYLHSFHRPSMDRRTVTQYSYCPPNVENLMTNGLNRYRTVYTRHSTDYNVIKFFFSFASQNGISIIRFLIAWI